MYPSRATLVAASSQTALTGATAPEQDAYHAAAKRAVEAFCHQRFDSELLTLTLDGNGSQRLGLPRRLAALTVLAVDRSGLDAADVAISNERDAIYVKPTSLGGGNWVERALRDYPGVEFTAGSGTIAITGTWGWSDAELPATADTVIGIAMRLDMEDQALADDHGLASTVRAAARMGLSNIQEGALTATIVHPDTLLRVEAQLLLEDYVWQPQAIVA